jgi:hypothetical protein
MQINSSSDVLVLFCRKLMLSAGYTVNWPKPGPAVNYRFKGVTSPADLNYVIDLAEFPQIPVDDYFQKINVCLEMSRFRHCREKLAFCTL